MDLSVFTESPLRDHSALEGASWLDANWMFLSVSAGLVLALWLMFSPRLSGTLKERLRDPWWWGMMAVSLYTLQQLEKHGFDLFGRRYMFVPVYNAGTGASMGVEVTAHATTPSPGVSRS